MTTKFDIGDKVYFKINGTIDRIVVEEDGKIRYQVDIEPPFENELVFKNVYTPEELLYKNDGQKVDNRRKLPFF